MIRKILLLLLYSLLFNTFAYPQSKTHYKNVQISGTIQGNRYISPEGRFSIEIPSFIIKEAVIIEDTYEGTETNVFFSDDFGKYMRIDSYSLDEKTKTQLQEHGEEAEKALLSNMQQKIETLFKSSVPKSKLIHQQVYQNKGVIYNFMVFDFPEGGTLLEIDNQSPQKNKKRQDVKRGVLSFIKNNTVFNLSMQYPDSPTATLNVPEEHINMYILNVLWKWSETLKTNI